VAMQVPQLGGMLRSELSERGAVSIGRGGSAAQLGSARNVHVNGGSGGGGGGGGSDDGVGSGFVVRARLGLQHRSRNGAVSDGGTMPQSQSTGAFDPMGMGVSPQTEVSDGWMGRSRDSPIGSVGAPVTITESGSG